VELGVVQVTCHRVSAIGSDEVWDQVSDQLAQRCHPVR
jgi:hypothetical protein